MGNVAREEGRVGRRGGRAVLGEMEVRSSIAEGSTGTLLCQHYSLLVLRSNDDGQYFRTAQAAELYEE